MRKLFLLTIFTIGATLISFGQDKAADLKRLFEIMDSEKMVNTIMDSMIPMLKQQASSQIQGENAKERFDKYMDFVFTETKALTKKLMDVEMVQIYDKYFTEQDIKDLIKFYESPVGKKMLAISPELSKELMNAMMTKYLPEFQEKMIKKMEELK